MRASEQEKEIQGGMVGKKEVSGAGVLVAGVLRTSDPWCPQLEVLHVPSYRIFLSTYQMRCALRALNEAALCATA